MKKSRLMGILFAGILVTIALSVNAWEGIGRDTLNLVLVVSNALLGFLLLRKVNNG